MKGCNARTSPDDADVSSCRKLADGSYECSSENGWTVLCALLAADCSIAVLKEHIWNTSCKIVGLELGEGENAKLLLQKSIPAIILRRIMLGLTPLHVASMVGNVGTVRWLVENGADCTIRDDSGSTPLHAAAAFERADVVAFLQMQH